MIRSILLLIVFVLASYNGKASHALGGDITWTCVGGEYVFQLTFFRDCNEVDINPVSENLEVWNHPTLFQIQVNFVSRTDMSPICTQVAGGPVPLSCGSGANGGNGIGAIEKIIYQSSPITITGTPPATGWIFTYKTFSRSSSTNLLDPSLYGITLASTIYESPNITSQCPASLVRLCILTF